MPHPHPYEFTGQTVKVATRAPISAMHGDVIEIRVEDWWDRVAGQSWMFARGNPACLSYAIRAAVAGLPTDDEVIYGKDEHGLGHLIHDTEIVREAVASP